MWVGLQRKLRELVPSAVGTVRNVTTSTELMEQLARLAGWKVVRWIAGNAREIRLDGGAMHALGQSILVLEKPGA